MDFFAGGAERLLSKSTGVDWSGFAVVGDGAAPVIRSRAAQVAVAH